MSYEIKAFAPIGFLAELREEVLQHSLKRMPKWKFRLAPDVVMQLQPQPTMMLSAAAMARGIKPKLQHYLGVAVMAEGVTGEVFKTPHEWPASPWGLVKFEIFTDHPAADWFFRRTGGRWLHSFGREGCDALTERVVAAFRAGLFAGPAPAKMLSHHCLICGKGLTDPASMARWIGPECAGTSTLRVPYTIAASADAEQAA